MTSLAEEVPPSATTTTTTTTTTSSTSVKPISIAGNNNGKARLSPASLFGVSADAVLSVSDDEWRKQLQLSVRDALTFEMRMRERGRESAARQTGSNVWRGCDQNVALRIQSGPSCGLVALQLALEHALKARVDADGAALLACAVRRECSKLGEMFIAAELAAVANDVYSGRLGAHSVRLLALDELAADDDARVAALVRLLRRRALILIAYDADKDNTPAQLGGSRAHWAVIKGFLQPCATGDEVMVLLDDDGDGDDNADNTAVRAADMFFTCLHSKSKRPALWRADALLQSSAQLTTPDNSRNTDNQYVMPQNLRECLALKVVVIEWAAPN